MTNKPTRNPCELAAPAAVPPGYVLVLVNELADLRARAGFSDGWIVWPPCSVDQVAAAVAREREACAALCDDHASIEGIAQRCAAAIRAR